MLLGLGFLELETIGTIVAKYDSYHFGIELFCWMKYKLLFWLSHVILMKQKN